MESINAVEPKSEQSNWVDIAVWKKTSQTLRAALHARKTDSEIRHLLSAVLARYSSSVNLHTIQDSLKIMSGCGYTPLEAAFAWLGRWRPTTAIRLVGSTLGSHNVKMIQILCCTLGMPVSNNMMLSQNQLWELDVLQEITSCEESRISNQHADFQMLLVEQELVKTLQSGVGLGDALTLSKGQEVICSKLPDLLNLFFKADQLRLQTLKEIYKLLTPTQAALCTIVACDFFVAFKAVGAKFMAKTL